MQLQAVLRGTGALTANQAEYTTIGHYYGAILSCPID